VIERDPKLVMKDLEEDLMSHDIARDIYQVVYDEKTLIVDEAATRKLRDDYRKQRIKRGKPFDKFCKEWVTKEPPSHFMYFGSWDDPKTIYATTMGQRVTMPSNQLQGAFMINPKDLRIGALEGEVAALKKQLDGCLKTKSKKKK